MKGVYNIECKERIVIKKKLDFEILTYLCVLRSPESNYAVFAVMHARMCVCVSEHNSILTVFSTELKFYAYCIDFGEFKYSSFTEQKKNSYILQPMAAKY